MRRRQPLPRLWMMTDERQGEGLWEALERLPRGSGVVFRHYGLSPPERRRLFRKVRCIARRKRLLLVLAGPAPLAKAWGADGSHGGSARSGGGLLRSVPVHDARELAEARRLGADLVFLSPLYETASHPGGRALGPLRFAALASRAHAPVIALGGLGARDMRRVRSLGAHGWAAIDYWSRKAGQKRKAVPT
jgi:thiamine-phosphate pyrophosphorylase